MTRSTLSCWIVVAGLVVFSGSFPPTACLGGEKEDRLELKIELLEEQIELLRSRLAKAEKQRDAALRLADDAKRQVTEALRHAADANSQRDAARKEAATSRDRAAFQMVAFRERTSREKDDLRKQANAEKAEMRVQFRKDIDAIRKTANEQIETTQGELAATKQKCEVYKERMEDAEKKWAYYTELDDAERQLAIHYYAEGIRDMEQRDYPKAVEHFTAAIEQYPKDARFFYMRAFVRHMTNKSSDKRQLDAATRDAKRGATVERLRGPKPRVVNVSLERYQGDSRLWLEKHRLMR